MERSKKTVLGIDIGGSKIRGIRGNKFWEFKTPKKKKDFIEILKKFPKADAVGIGVAGVVKGTKVVRSQNIKYLNNFDFRKIFSRVRVDNDARAFLRAEARHLVAKSPSRILGITIGTGIGRAYSNKKYKTLEYPEKWEHEFQNIRDKKYKNIKDFKNDKKLAEYLGTKISELVEKLKPGLIILGGGVLGRKGFFEMLKKRLRIKTMRSKLGNKAGAMGAAMLWK